MGTEKQGSLKHAFVLNLVGDVFKWWVAVAEWAERIFLAIFASHAELQDLKIIQWTDGATEHLDISTLRQAVYLFACRAVQAAGTCTDILHVPLAFAAQAKRLTWTTHSGFSFRCKLQICWCDHHAPNMLQTRDVEHSYWVV
jgi:hypothetical protein